MYGRIKNIHFVGIGGIGMSGIAEVLLNLGYGVTGSDIKSTETVERLKRLGSHFTLGHRIENVSAADVVVISSAIKEDNPEVIAAKSRNIPVIRRAEMLSELMRLKYGIAVAGSHGKTTTTSMISTVLAYGGFDPTIVVGGRVRSLGTNAHLGNGEFMVVEADESDGSFLLLSPVIAVLTNIDEEHLDHYQSIERLEYAFSEFLNKVPFYGLAVICLDSGRIRSIIPRFKKRIVTYGFSNESEFKAGDINVSGFQTDFKVLFKNSLLGCVALNVPGRHNAQNALASFAVGMELGMSFEDVKEGLFEFKGIDRRIQLKGEINGVRVIDDYAHHPEEIRVTLNALKESFSSRVIVIFQPHRFTRTSILFDEFVRVLSDVDMLFLIDIYPAGEEPIEGVSSARLAHAIKEKGNKNVFYVENPDDVIDNLISLIRPGDVVVTIGAGNVWMIGERLLEELL
ncbi:MAG: UDP-N-acetylmuramate--L-alanine ligase [Deltaproteobacteria bacterium]|nr:UDP-N-acetylmuramate--L-alanine ligase [Deltaproteobacteria bacterium]